MRWYLLCCGIVVACGFVWLEITFALSEISSFGGVALVVFRRYLVICVCSCHSQLPTSIVMFMYSGAVDAVDDPKFINI
jgi:hypothetical protein